VNHHPVDSVKEMSELLELVVNDKAHTDGVAALPEKFQIPNQRVTLLHDSPASALSDSNQGRHAKVAHTQAGQEGGHVIQVFSAIGK